jgi:hypothetical protein
MGESLQYLRTQTVEGQAADIGDLAKQWRTAHDRIRRLGAIDAGAADEPEAVDLPTSVVSLADDVLAHPITRQSFGMTSNEIKLVDLDQLVVFQKHINLTYAGELQATLGEEPTDEDLVHFCLPTDGRYDPMPNVAPIQYGPIGAQVWAGVSPSTDYRVLSTALLDPSQVTGLDSTGRPTHVIAVAVGYGSNFLCAMRVGSRLILRNGSHRAFALRAGGHTRAPVLIQNIPAGEESEFLPPEVEQQRELYLSDPRPPLVRDYFEDELRAIVHVPRKTKQIRVIVTYEESGAPGA